MRYSDEDLRRMKTRRRELVAEYGDKGQHHPMGRMIGGLNPAAQELHVLRGKIAEAESERRAPSSVLTPLPGSKSGYGLKFDIEYQGRRGKLGTDNFGRWYIIAGEGSQADVVASDFKTKGEAAKAFARLSKTHSSGTALHHATKKKSPVQLQREIDAALRSADREKHGYDTERLSDRDFEQAARFEGKRYGLTHEETLRLVRHPRFLSIRDDVEHWREQHGFPAANSSLTRGYLRSRLRTR